MGGETGFFSSFLFIYPFARFAVVVVVVVVGRVPTGRIA